MLITRTSMLTNKEHTLDVPLSEEEFRTGAKAYYVDDNYIQDAFPTLSAPWREYIMTGITPQEWKKEFGM